MVFSFQNGEVCEEFRIVIWRFKSTGE